MAKKSNTKKGNKKKNIFFQSYQVRIYILSAIVGLATYLGGIYLFKPPVPCANSLTCTSDLTEKIDNGAIGLFQGHPVKAPIIDPLFAANQPNVLGDNVPTAPKHIYVDLAAQTLYAYQGSTKIMQTLIASGRWGKTPVGNFNVWEKLISTTMAGGEGADAYNLPNVPYVMYFFHDFGLHGAYWHDDYGHTMSHGCVNMRPIDAKALFAWADGPANGKLGTPVSICNHFTQPNICEQDNPIN